MPNKPYHLGHQIMATQIAKQLFHYAQSAYISDFLGR